MPFQRAQRLEKLPPYLFIEIARKRRAAIAAGKDVIDFGVGDPDRPTPGFIVDRMAEAIRDPVNHRYPQDNGGPAFRQAAAAWFAKRFGVSVDADHEVLALIGTKEGIGHLPLAVADPNDVVLVPQPGYPVYEAAAFFAGATPHYLPLSEANRFLPDLDAVPAAVLDRTALLFVNYPNNPTGAVAGLDFFEKCVALARRHDFVICSDAAYSEVYFDANDRPHSILEVSGAKDVCVEFHSLSKTFNMTGWRIGFGVGNADVLAALSKIKGNMDSGPFTAIQQAAIAALEGIDRPEVAGIRELYRERRDALVPGLNRLGFRTVAPRAGFYIWAACPGGLDSMACAGKLLEEASIVAVPGVGFGKPGEGYLRFALTLETPRIREAVERLSRLRW